MSEPVCICYQEPDKDYSVPCPLHGGLEAQNRLREVVALIPRNLACEKWPDRVALPPDYPACGACPRCRLYAALSAVEQGGPSRLREEQP